MASSYGVDPVPGVDSSTGSSSTAYDATTQANNAYNADELLTKAEEAKHKPAGGGENSVEDAWDFSKEQVHKLYENLCNSFVNQCKEDQDKMKEALQQLQQSTAISG